MTFKKYWLFAVLGIILASLYPMYMGFIVVFDMITKGTVYQEDYPKYIIPYTPISLAVITAVILMPVFFRYARRFYQLAASVLSLVIFFCTELLLEKWVVVTSEVTSTLESWQMYMCIVYLPPEDYEPVTRRAVDVLIGDYSPAFKLHFYLMAVILIISLLNCLYGFAQVFREGQCTRLKALVVQSVCTALFLGLCILACFTAFYRNGNITVPTVSAILMSLFFVLFGVTAGVYASSILLNRKTGLSIVLPSVIAASVTLIMYIGEMILLNGRLYRFGSGWVLEGIPGIVLAPVDIGIIALSGCITAVIGYSLNRKQH